MQEDLKFIDCSSCHNVGSSSLSSLINKLTYSFITYFEQDLSNYVYLKNLSTTKLHITYCITSYRYHSQVVTNCLSNVSYHSSRHFYTQLWGLLEAWIFCTLVLLDFCMKKQRRGPILGSPVYDKCQVCMRLSSLCTTIESRNGQEFGLLVLLLVKAPRW